MSSDSPRIDGHHHFHPQTVEETVREMDEAFNRGDIDGLVDFYEDGATVVVEPGRLARGKNELRRMFHRIVGNMTGMAKQERTYVIENADIALFTSKWSFSGKSNEGADLSREAIATSVFRKQPDGQWKCAIDNSYGPAVLD